MLHVTCYMLHVTCYMLHVTCSHKLTSGQRQPADGGHAAVLIPGQAGGTEVCRHPAEQVRLRPRVAARPQIRGGQYR